MEFKRSAGILLHLASLPGSMGIGDLGKGAYRFVDWLQQAGQTWWQILPFGPLTSENQPYTSQSSWAGAYEYIDVLSLVDTGELSKKDVRGATISDSARVNYEKTRKIKGALLAKAAENFFNSGKSERYAEYQAFCKSEKWWLDDWAVFAALKVANKNRAWWEWSHELSLHDEKAVNDFIHQNRELISFQKYYQFVFSSQWQKLRAYAASKGVKFIGDIPIYCARDSQDVWANLSHFSYDSKGRQLGQAGVPPDCFSATGQLWGGNPVYNWEVHKAEKFKWWMNRLRGSLAKTDLVRLDHFMGFQRYWDVPANEKTAMNGSWKAGPGDEFFKAAHRTFGDAPFIAEDLGLITEEVRNLRDHWKLPGMRVLQFAFGGGTDNEHLPHLHNEHCIVYTGTHDNDTAAGWYKSLPKKERDYFWKYAGKGSGSPVRALMRLAYSSVACMAIVPMQDVLELGSKARQNLPGATVRGGNYRWKLVPKELSAAKAKEIREMTEAFGR